MPEIPQLVEKGFPVKVKQAVNALNKRTRKLDEFTADEPLRLRVSDANMKLSMSEEALRLLRLLSQLEDSGLLNEPAGGNTSTQYSQRDFVVCTNGVAETVRILVAG